MNDFGDLLGTPYAPVSKIAPVKVIGKILGYTLRSCAGSHFFGTEYESGLNLGWLAILKKNVASKTN